ncbi:MAG: HEAT repeat domain-containing protein [Candidatus Hydrogenedentes bacterium]|nr:HEAT repeat domain-containing protein [Candidatus Hydrogenedentota bacterium]
MRKNILAVAILAGGAGTSFADTITLPDGSTMDGVVREINANCVALTVGDNTMEFQRSEIGAIEKNDKKGDPSKPLLLPSVHEHQRKLDEATGLTADERERILGTIEALHMAHEPGDRQKAESNLVALNKTLGVVKFIKASLDYRCTMARRMEYLDALAVLDPAAAGPLLDKGVVNPFAPMRALCIRLLAAIQNPPDKADLGTLTTFARGLLDFDADVQFAAGTALVKCGQKTVTPVLLAKLDDPETRIRNIANQALTQIWGVDAATVPEDRAAFWKDFWSKNAAGVTKPLDPASLQPLVDKEAVPVMDGRH